MVDETLEGLDGQEQEQEAKKLRQEILDNMKKQAEMVEEGREMRKVLKNPRVRGLFLRNYAAMIRFLLEGGDQPPDVLLRVVFKLQTLYEMHSQMFGSIVTAAEIIEYMKLNPDVGEIDLHAVAHQDQRYLDPLVETAVMNTEDAAAIGEFTGADEP